MSRGLGLLLLGSTLVALLAVSDHLKTVLFLRVHQVQFREPLFEVLKRRHRRVFPVVLHHFGAFKRRTQHLGPVASTRGVPGVAEDGRRKLLHLVKAGLSRQPLEHPSSTGVSKSRTKNSPWSSSLTMRMIHTKRVETTSN